MAAASRDMSDGFDGAGRWRDARGRFATLPSPCPPAPPRTSYRLTLFGRPHGPWHDSADAAMTEAVARGLASWDESRREQYVSVPVGLERNIAWS